MIRNTKWAQAPHMLLVTLLPLTDRGTSALEDADVHRDSPWGLKHPQPYQVRTHSATKNKLSPASMHTSTTGSLQPLLGLADAPR